MKPVLIDAFQWRGDDSLEGYPEWFLEKTCFDEVWESSKKPGTYMIEVYNGMFDGGVAGPGDWVYMHSDGTVYPISDKDFKETYEPIE
jgi:hypothetical protein